MRARFTTALFPLLLLLAPGTGVAQGGSAQAELIALAERALQLISDEDFVGLTDLMVEDASIYSVAERAGELLLRHRTRSDERTVQPTRDFVERGFTPEARVAGRIGIVWLPYDFYVDGEWSHCGVDVFTMLRGADGWKIASLAYTVAQPPECEPHPDGPPGGAER